PGGISMILTREEIRWVRLAADALTFSRLMLGLAMLVCPLLLEQSRALAAVLWLNLAGLATDALDGELGRYSGTALTWIGKNDYLFDLGLAFCTTVALARLGFLWWWFPVAWAPCFLYFSLRFPTDTVRMGFLFILLVPPPFLALVYQRTIGLAYILFIILAAAFKYQRLIQNINLFIEGLPGAGRQRLQAVLRHLLKDR
ncbi:MAG: CDP-alcohol phosphatidyltransferase family protein, partial [Bacillota bacterium]